MATMTIQKLTDLLGDAAEAIERLACGEAGLLPEGTTAHELEDFLEVVQMIATVVEEETDKSFVRLDDSELGDLVGGWLERAEKVDERHGEEAGR